MMDKDLEMVKMGEIIIFIENPAGPIKRLDYLENIYEGKIYV